MFSVIRGVNLWRMYEEEFVVGITTNTCLNMAGMLVMGKGIALQAKSRMEYLPAQWAKILPLSDVYYDTLSGLVRLPTKLDWKRPSPMPLIISTTRQLAAKALLYPHMQFAVPPLGCGNGGLNWEKCVEPIFRQEAVPDNVTVVLP